MMFVRRALQFLMYAIAFSLFFGALGWFALTMGKIEVEYMTAVRYAFYPTALMFMSLYCLWILHIVSGAMMFEVPFRTYQQAVERGLHKESNWRKWSPKQFHGWCIIKGITLPQKPSQSDS